MNEEITVTVNKKQLRTISGTLLSDIIKNEKPCGGHGKCGKCKMKVSGNVSKPCEEELRLLSPEELRQGIRLTCRTYVYGDCCAESISDSENVQILTDGIQPELGALPMFKHYGIAIDIGTTTLAARLYDAKGTLICEASNLNPQSEWGADVISRVESALDGKQKALSTAVRNAIDEIISSLANGGTIKPEAVDGVVITGNTVMLSLLTEESTKCFSKAPFQATRLFDEMLTAEELSLSCLDKNTPIYIPVCISAFVGADISCALLASGLCKQKTAMLADIGTNGEMALWHNGRLTVCSTAAGPAFEGVGISMGMRGSAGAIDKVCLSENKLQVHVIGETEPSGICGSGLVDAIACMLDMDVLDESGFLEDETFNISGSVAITQKDIRMLQLAKSAICAGITTLYESIGLNASDIPSLYIAGGFGNFLNKENAVKIGLLPKELANASQAVGNAALGGASMLLLDFSLRDKMLHDVQQANVLDLSSNPAFSEHYMTGMLLGEI